MQRRKYNKQGLVLRRGHQDKSQVRELQKDLRALGYLYRGIDGDFGRQTERAIKSIQYDLLNNHGDSTANDGAAPLSIVNFNRGRVFDITGILDQALAACMHDMLLEENYPKLPFSDHPVTENQAVIHTLNNSDFDIPVPFLIAMLRQESNLQHYQVPLGNNQDNFITVGLDRNSKKVGAKDAITSRGYGAGQYTLFHHPPHAHEVQDFMVNPVGNVSKAAEEYRHKFDRFVNGPTSGTRADDRIVEVGAGPLRECKYKQSDSKYLRDCKACLQGVSKATIKSGDRFYVGSRGVMTKTQYYKTETYKNVPLRKEIPCDWPYASRRYNGAGVNSYHYQIRILKNVLRGE